jgi:tryptophan halogenase
MVENVLVVGGGSAGLIAALTLKARLPELAVTIVRSKEIGIIGVGEGSTLALPQYLHGLLGVDPDRFVREAQPTWKLGLRFVRWGPRRFFDYTFAPQLNATWNDLRRPIGFYCDDAMEFACVNSALCSHDRAFARGPKGEPVVNRDFGYHVENVTFVAFLEAHAARAGVKFVEDTVREVRRDAVTGGVASLLLASGRTLSADLYVDCSGFGSLLLGKTLGEPFVSYKPTLFCDRAVVGGWERAADEPIRPYTTCEGMDAGWCWRIDHEHRVNRGYVYSSAFITDDDAEREFRAANPKVGPTRIVKFVSGRYERAWVANVVAIGNAAGFVEPLEATSLGAICDESYVLAEALIDSANDPGPALINLYNRHCGQNWDFIRDFLAIHYRFNTRFDTPFWRACRESVDLAGAAAYVEFYQENGPSTAFRRDLVHEQNPFKMEGLLTLMQGQRVPYRKRYAPPPRERVLWNEIRTHLRAQGAVGYSVKEMLDLCRSGRWQWNPAAFRPGGGQQAVGRLIETPPPAQVTPQLQHVARTAQGQASAAGGWEYLAPPTFR